MDTTLIRQAAAGSVPPALVAATILLVARLLRRGGTPPWATPLAIGLGYAAGHVALQGWPRAPLEADVKDSLAWVALAAAVAGALFARGRRLWALHLAGAVLLPWYLLDFMREHHWSAAAAWAWTGGLAVAALGLTTALEALARRRPGPELPLLWLCSTALAALALWWGQSASLAQLAGALCIPLAVTAALARDARSRVLAGGGVLAFGWLALGLLGAGCFAAELPGASAVAAALAPLAGWLGELGPWSRRRGSRRLVGLLAVLLLGALAAWLALVGRPADPYAAYR